MQLQQAPAPGARALIRDEEWIVHNADVRSWAVGSAVHRHLGEPKLANGATSRSSFHYICMLPTVVLLRSYNCG